MRKVNANQISEYTIPGISRTVQRKGDKAEVHVQFYDEEGFEADFTFDTTFART